MQIEKRLRRLTLLLRKVRGGLLLGEFFRRVTSVESRIVKIDDFDGDLTMYLDLSEHMQGQIFWHGAYSVEIVELLRQVLPVGGFVIDCGANIGEITLLSAKHVGEHGRVYAFEPILSLADKLEKHVRVNGFENVEIVRSAVGQESGTLPIYVASERFVDGSHHDGLGTLYSSESRSELLSRVPIVSIDDFVTSLDPCKIDLIKIDIEGGELPALRGAAHTLKTFRPSLIVEVGESTCVAGGYRMEDVYNFLADAGYEIYRIRRRGKLERISAVDLFEFQNLYCVARCH